MSGSVSPSWDAMRDEEQKPRLFIPNFLTPHQCKVTKVTTSWSSYTRATAQLGTGPTCSPPCSLTPGHEFLPPDHAHRPDLRELEGEGGVVIPMRVRALYRIHWSD
ncbi:hypothetical protein MLD38_003849 [Melastoma candidum]|uniref:Uncharacterized protein n=1 Tax=Melastoma candidum TaxID=119954 RepID=A0ACB9S3Z2_9MYRT|nr:hypothetical protein MLD38_003849 [Melastoma candidum]